MGWSTTPQKLRGTAVVSALLFLACFSVAALCQNSTIRLEVSDHNGQPLIADIEIKRGNSSQRISSDRNGAATVSLSPGEYSIAVVARGFQKAESSLQLGVGATITRKFSLNLAPLTSSVNVVATTPLPGSELEPSKYPAPYRSLPPSLIDDSSAGNLTDLLEKGIAGLTINSIQGNPHQVDVSYRGFSASPLLGTPQGLSVYLDGVRLNQPLGEVVSWDLIPVSFLETVTVLPGSSSAFGLNSLGGAVVLQSKSLPVSRFIEADFSGGSFGRKNLRSTAGLVFSKGWSLVAGTNLFFEDGWRVSSPSNVRQFFGKAGRQTNSSSLFLTVTFANNSLAGNGLQEKRFLDTDYRGIYTKPDITDNKSPFINLSWQHSLSDVLRMSATAYFRSIKTATLNSDLNENALDQSIYQPSAADRLALTAAGYTGFPSSGANAANTPFPFWRCIAQVLQNDEPAEKCDGLINRSQISQSSFGFSFQATLNRPIGSKRNLLNIGSSFDRSRLGLIQTTQLGYLNPDFSITGVNAYADGKTGGNIDGVPFDLRVNLGGSLATASVFATDTFTLTKALSVTASARLNSSRLKDRDRVTPGGVPGSLDANYSFYRVNPSIGVSYSPEGHPGIYFSYTEGSRAPSTIELGCADPNRPCRLPNAMAGDPPLNQVKARTYQAGIRSEQGRKLSWDLGVFSTSDSDDILFVASPQTGFGYFKNFGLTRRRGIEAELSTQWRRLYFGSSLALLNASYRTAETLNGTGNSSNDAAAKGLEGSIQISPGNRMPLSPGLTAKLYSDIELPHGLEVGVSLSMATASYVRGNENNLHQPDGIYYLGPGKIPGYAIASTQLRYRLNGRIGFHLTINNLFDTRFYTAGLLGVTGFSSSRTVVARPFAAIGGNFPLVQSSFLAPGAPRAFVGGMTIKLKH